MKTIKQILAKSILGIAVLSLFLFTASCSQDSVIDNEDLHVVNAKSSEAKKATRAIRGKINNAPTTSDIPPNFDCGFPLSANDIFGNMTHLGKIQPMSYGIPQSCAPGTEPGTLDTEYLVNYVGAHGDEIWTREFPTIICDDAECLTGSFEGNIEIIGGTGRFAEATGSMVFVDARFNGGVSTWRVEGRITY